MPHPDDRRSEIDLHEYVRVLRRRKWTVLLCLMVTLGVALGTSYLSTPSYSAGAEVLVQPGQAQATIQSNGSQSGSLDRDRLLADEIQFATGDDVRAQVAKKVGYRPNINVGQGNADSLNFNATGPDAAKTARSANTYAQVFLDARRVRYLQDFLKTIESVQGRITDLQRQRASASAADQLAIDSTLSGLQQTLNQLQLSNQANQQGIGVITHKAQVPGKPTSPNIQRSAIVGGVIGLLLGLIMAFVLERLDTSIKSKDDLERATRTTVLGLVPKVGGWKDRERAMVVSLNDPSAPAAEAYRGLRTSLQFSTIDKDLRSVLVTSSRAGEGKTTTAANLAVAMARTGKRIVVVCCDLRRARLNEFFGLPNKVGFTSILLGETTVDQAVQWVDSAGVNFGVLTSGPLAPDPSELLASKRAKSLLSALAKTFDTVIIDSPPLLPVSDALVLSADVDGVVLVANSRTTSYRQVHRAAELLRQVDAPIVGTVLNSVSHQGTVGYGYDYDYSQRYAPITGAVAGNGNAPASRGKSEPVQGR